MGYSDAGWHLGIHTAHLLEFESDEEFDEKLQELRSLLDLEDDEGVLRWYEREFPRCMGLIPKRRQGRFLKGLYSIDEDRTITDC